MALDGVRFAKDGPLIPIQLLHTLEEGRLTVFCGAGVSRRLPLPDFDGLVKDVCTHLGWTIQDDEKELVGHKSFDAALGLIENRLVEKSKLRKAVAHVLEVKEGADLGTHKALLNLAASAKGNLRLVTTNFDRAFELAGSSGKLTFDYAPYLPLPGVDWNSVVHLHGGLGNTRDPDRESLVLTSADFGRAYITEGWASRFLGELFRRSEAVLFVGYSVGDPAVRYIVDAFAADRDKRSHVAIAYILSGSDPPAQDARTWTSRGIEPISYDPRQNHVLLHETLRNCAARYRTGFFDRASIVLEYGSHSPVSALDREATSQIIWALRDGTGHAARRFAELAPPAPIDWLDILAAEGLLGLGRDGPSSVPAVMLFPASYLATPLHPVTLGLCDWFCAHLDKKELVLWAVENGGHLHPQLADMVRRRLAQGAAARIPRGADRIWMFLSSTPAAVHSRAAEHEVFADLENIEAAPWDPLLRDRVLFWLAPTIRFKKPFRWDSEDFDAESVSSYVDVELIPASGEEGRHVVSKLLARPDADTILRELIGEFTGILHRGMTYLEFLGSASDDVDHTYIEQPSIDEHPSNGEFGQQSVYVRLLRVAWERVAATDPEVARCEVSQWMRLRYPLFRRFVLWSAGKTGGLSASESVEYLSKQTQSALWGLDTHRELLQYLGRIGASLSSADANSLVSLILRGPPRAQYRAEFTAEEFAEIADREIHNRLAKLRDGGLTLPPNGQEAWNGILERHPAWPLSIAEVDEFVGWSGRGAIVAFNDLDPPVLDYLKWTDDEIISDLAVGPTSRETVRRWRGLLDADVQRGIRILEILGQSGRFIVEIWELALDYLGSMASRAECLRLYSEFAPLIGPVFMTEHVGNVSSVINRYYHEKDRAQEGSVWRLWDLLLEPASLVAPGDDADPVMKALNSPIGSLAEALLIKVGELSVKTYEEVPEPFRGRIRLLLEGAQPAYRLSRLVLARALAWLYRLNSDLVAERLLPRFDWEISEEARHVWSGYLTGPRITPELWPALRPLLLKVFPHSGNLGRYEDPFYSLFASVVLHPDLELESAEARHALTVGSPKGRSRVAWFWWRQADSATDYGEKLYWGRLKYLLTDVWPVDRDLREEGSSHHLAELATCCGTAFPDAVGIIIPLLTKLRRPHEFIWSFNRKNLAESYPEASLALIDAVVGNVIEQWGWQDLRGLINRILAADITLAEDPRLVRLQALLRQFE